MSLADRLSAAPETPPARRPRARVENLIQYDPAGKPSEVAVSLDEIPEDEQAWRDEIKRVTGLDVPEDREVKLSQVRMWTSGDQEHYYCRFVIEDRAASGGQLDIDDLIKAAKKAKAPKQRATTERGLVVAWADLQVGKVGSRGGAQELVERVMAKLDALEKHAKRVKADSVYLIDAGDCVESFENTSEQQWTNDLSFPEQIRLARRLFTEAALRLARLHPAMTVAAVPSNHGRWRRGKGNLGRPGDDYGIEILTQVADAFALNPDALGHVRFVVPEVWDETIALDIHGTILAVAHGHQASNPDRIPQWWANQVHGGQPAADADILLTAHFHHLRVQPTGRNPHSGRSKWWFQAPTLDNGSDWFRLKSGSDSDPGLLTFTVDAEGWSNLEVL